MKKCLTVLMALALSFSLAACGQTTNNERGGSNAPAPAETETSPETGAPAAETETETSPETAAPATEAESGSEQAEQTDTGTDGTT